MGPEGARKAPGPQPPSEEKGGLDPLEILRFVAKAARRHVPLGLVVFALVAALGILIASAVPSTYEVTSKIFDTQSSAITATVAGARHGDERSGMRGVREIVLSHDNLLSMTREARLLESWDKTRSWPLRLKDQVMTELFGPLPDADKEHALIELLEKAITVETEENASIRFRVQWRDPESTFRLAELAKQNFLRVRNTSEVAAVSRAIGLLEGELQRADLAIDPAIKEVQRLLDKQRAERGQASASALTPAHKPGRRPIVAAAAQPTESTPQVPHESTLQLTSKLDDLRRAQRELLEPWQRRSAELRIRLAELRSIYGPEHPLVRQQEAKVAAASETPPELADLKQQEASLMTSLSALGSATGSATTTPSGRKVGSLVAPTGGMQSQLRAMLEQSESPEIAAARARLDSTLSKSREVHNRLDDARMEIATANASFQHRWAVVEAPELPRKAVKPKRSLLYAGAVLVALFLGFLAGGVRELMTGRVIDSFQVRSLGIDVLGEVRLDEPPRGGHSQIPRAS